MVKKGDTCELELEIGSNGRVSRALVNGNEIHHVIGANVHVSEQGPALVSLEWIAWPGSTSVRVNVRGEVIGLSTQDLGAQETGGRGALDMFSDVDIDNLIAVDGESLVGRLAREVKSTRRMAQAAHSLSRSEFERQVALIRQLKADLKREISEREAAETRLYMGLHTAVDHLLLPDPPTPQEWAY